MTEGEAPRLQPPAGGATLADRADAAPWLGDTETRPAGPPTAASALVEAAGSAAALRLAGGVLADGRWVVAAAAPLGAAAAALKAAVADKKLWAGLPPFARRAAAAAGAAAADAARAARAAAGKPPSAALSARAALTVVVAADSAYNAIWEHFLAAAWAAPAVVPPHLYFPAAAEAHPGAVEALDALLTGPGAAAAPKLEAAWGGPLVGGAVPPGADPLARVVRARLLDAARLLWETGLTGDGALDELAAERRRAAAAPTRAPKRPPPSPSSSATSDSGAVSASGSDSSESDSDSDGSDAPAAASSAASTAWPADAALAAWRASARECHSYAYAVPSPPAIAALAALSPLVEVGGGTGWWAAALARAGADVVAVDAAPPKRGGRSNNAYHGALPPVGPPGVRRGGPRAAADPARTLFLCYPPPDGAADDDMGLAALQATPGDTVAVVGEAGGETGTRAFWRALARGWALATRVPLPNWADSAAELMIFRRRGGGGGAGDGQGQPLVSCAACGASRVALRRCAWCRAFSFCSPACAANAATVAVHDAEHALRGVALAGGVGSLPFAAPDFDPVPAF